MNYRPEIDGLRALAIVPVVLYHAGVPGLPGGFVGVDIFFVISGFLITSIVASEIEAERFTIAGFYERRARRILPVFFLVTSVVLTLGWITLPPASLLELTHSAAAATLFVSNVYFWQAVSYFSSDAEFWPLIHTWSLAVEEQFYVLFPLFLMLFMPRVGRGLTQAILLVLVFLSLALCLVGSYTSTSATFYLLPTRLWEIGLGAWLALRALQRPASALWRETLSGFGALLILVSILAYRPEWPFPGWWALLPVLGTCLIVFCGGETRVGRALSWRPVVFIGLISYSLYLWHWPVLVYTRYASGVVDLPIAVIALCLVIMLVLSVLSWKYVEAPFRARANFTRGGVFALSGVAMAIVLGIALASHVTQGAPNRLTPEQLQTAEAIRDFRKGSHCWGHVPDDEPCLIGAENARATVMLWGDSHASALSPALDVVLQGRGLGAIKAVHGTCAALPGVLGSDIYHNTRCHRFNEVVLDWLRQGDHDIRHMVLTARWNLNVTGARMKGEAGEGVKLSIIEQPSITGNAQVVEASLQALVGELTDMGISVTLLEDAPEIAWNVPVTMFFRQRLGLDLPSSPDLAAIEARSAQTYAILARVAERPDVEFVKLAPDLCTPTCKVMHAGQPVYSDDDHFSIFGAQTVIAPLLAKLLGPFQ